MALPGLDDPAADEQQGPMLPPPAPGGPPTVSPMAQPGAGAGMQPLGFKEALPFVLAQALASGAAGMSPNPDVQHSVQRNAYGGLQQFMQQRNAMAGQQGVARALDLFAGGDLAGARKVLTSDPMALLTPQGAQLHAKLASAEYGLKANAGRNTAFADQIEKTAAGYTDPERVQQAREYAAFIRGNANTLEAPKVVEEYGKRFVAAPVQVRGPGDSSMWVSPWTGQQIGPSTPGVLKGPYGMVQYDPGNPSAPGKVIPGTEEIPEITSDEKNGFAKIMKDPRQAAAMLASPDPAVQEQGRQLRQAAFLAGAAESSAKPTAEMGQAMNRNGDGQWANRPLSEIPRDVMARYYKQSVLDIADKESIRKQADLSIARGMRDSLPLWQGMPTLVGARIADSKNGGSVPIMSSGLSMGQAADAKTMADKKVIMPKEVPEYEHLLNSRDQIANLRNDLRTEIASGRAGSIGAGLTAKVRNLTGKENLEQIMAQLNPALVSTARALQGGRATNQELTALTQAFQPRAIQSPAAIERALGQFQRITDMSIARYEGRELKPLEPAPEPFQTKVLNGQKYVTRDGGKTWQTQ